MPRQKRFQTRKDGVHFIIARRKGGRTGQTEKIYYARFEKDGIWYEEKCGRQYADDMTPAKAVQVRSQFIDGTRPTRRKKRELKKAEVERYTISKLWDEYKIAKPNLKGWKTGTYDSLYNKHVAPSFGDKEPKDILPLDVKRVENRLLKTYSPQMVKHILNMLRILSNFGADNGLCPGLSFKIKMPTVNNVKTEDLSPDQLKLLFNAIESDDHPQAGAMMKMALYTGMRRGELFRLKWKHIHFDRKFIELVDPKGGPDQKIPLNLSTKQLLQNHRFAAEQQQKRKNPPKWSFSEHVFPGRGGGQRTRIDKAVNVIKKKAKLPKEFRPLHGLRHTYASTLASSGTTDLYVIQKLLGHKSPEMTQRYSHLRDETLQKASGVASDIFSSISEPEKNIINLSKK